ncbi:hypothetical protein V6N13_049912 [Hibiscus sabdariffa]|uniref:Uncharacterized protein n=1 Tax=Hibiscus sabdariffa TaxID=183260 RepID=A0ABR2QVQ7_9ROSI
MTFFLEGQIVPSELSRISISLNSKALSACALNDIFIAHPRPATVSRFLLKQGILTDKKAFKHNATGFKIFCVHVGRISEDDQTCLLLVDRGSRGLRISTAAGSTAAMLSAGGFAIPILSRDLQYIVREPISPGGTNSSLMRGLIKSDQSTDAAWFSKEGFIHFDGSHVFYHIQGGDAIEISSKAPVLQVVVPHLSS